MNVALATMVAAALVHSASASQVRVVRYGDDRLTGITHADVLVTLAGDTAHCSVDRARLQRLAVDTLRAAGLEASISETARSWFYSVVVRTNTATVSSACATAVTAELVAQVDGVPEADRRGPAGAWGSVLVGALSLVRETALVTSTPAEHPAPVDSALRVQLTTIGARIRAANR